MLTYHVDKRYLHTEIVGILLSDRKIEIYIYVDIYMTYPGPLKMYIYKILYYIYIFSKNKNNMIEANYTCINAVKRSK